MASYRELLEQREALQKQIDAVQAQEVAVAIERVRTIINEYSLTPDPVPDRTGARGAVDRIHVSKLSLLEDPKLRADKIDSEARNRADCDREQGQEWYAFKCQHRYAIRRVIDRSPRRHGGEVSPPF